MVRAKMFAVLFSDNNVDGPVRHFEEMPARGHSQEVDCTVCTIRRQNRWYKDVKVFFSRKHGFYALKNALLPTF